MCRIASLFLLQRLKGSKSGDASYFNTSRRELSSSFIFLLGKALQKIHAILRET